MINSREISMLVCFAFSLALQTTAGESKGYVFIDNLLNESAPTEQQRERRNFLENPSVKFLGQGHRGNVTTGKPYVERTPKKRRITDDQPLYQSPTKRFKLEHNALSAEEVRFTESVQKISTSDLSAEAKLTWFLRENMKKISTYYRHIPEQPEQPLDEPTYEMILQKADGETLEFIIQNSLLNQRQFLDLMNNLFRFFNELHSKLNYCHEDISPSNIVVALPNRLGFDAQHFMVIDWELAGEIDKSIRHITNSDIYSAPERFKNGFVSTPADVFSLGKIMERYFGATIYVDIKNLISDMTKVDFNSRISLEHAISALEKIIADYDTGSLRVETEEDSSNSSLTIVLENVTKIANGASADAAVMSYVSVTD